METYGESKKLDKMALIWTSGDREVALKMAFMYVNNSKKHNWWDVVRLIVWGPASKLLSEDEELQLYAKQMIANGVEIVACKSCSDSYGVSGKLSSLGVEVLNMGEPLTEMLKSDWKVLSV